VRHSLFVSQRASVPAMRRDFAGMNGLCLADLINEVAFGQALYGGAGSNQRPTDYEPVGRGTVRSAER
jgi:hypothetical protein